MFDPALVRQYLKQNNMTQADLARFTEKTPRTIARWLNPKEKIGREAIKRICEALGQPPETFDADSSELNFENRGEVQVGAKISKSAANGYLLLAKQLGISKKTIIEIAPVLFSIILERANHSEDRNEENTALLWAMIERLGVAGRFADSGETYEAAMNDLNAEQYNDQSPARGYSPDEILALMMASELTSLVRHLPTPSNKEISLRNWDSSGYLYNHFKGDDIPPQSTAYTYSPEFLSEFTDNDEKLIEYICEGLIDLSAMEASLWEKGNIDRRLRWLRRMGKAASAQIEREDEDHRIWWEEFRKRRLKDKENKFKKIKRKKPKPGPSTNGENSDET